MKRSWHQFWALRVYRLSKLVRRFGWWLEWWSEDLALGKKTRP